MSRISLVIVLASLCAPLLARAEPPNSGEEQAIRKVMRDYYEVFPRDSVAAAANYGEPVLFVRPQEVFVVATRAEISDMFTKALKNLKARGYSMTKAPDLNIKMLNSTTALCSTIAVRMKADGTELERSGFTYLLHKGINGWKINESIDTDTDKLMGAN